MATVLNSVERFLSYHGVDISDMQKMEFQVLASPEGGELVEGKLSTYSDGVTDWWSIRCPRNADSEPDFNDYELEWRLDEHAQSIGFTGWNWVDKKSVWVGFDYDSLTGHAEGVGLSDEQLKEVQRRLTEIPFVQVVRSTSGRGLHAYVTLEDGFSTQNHTEHAALARAIVGVMSTACGFDLAASVDCMGSILWKWSKSQAPNAFEEVKAAERKFRLDELPPNWKDNVAVVTRSRAKVRVEGISEGDEDFFNQLSSGRKRVELSDAHKSHLETLKELGGSCIWVSDHHLLQTHTAQLKKMHQRLGLKGVFDTVSEGRDINSPNAFMFPGENDSWTVVRFGRHVKEKATWKQNANGWTTCRLNVPPDFDVAMEFAGGGLLGDDRGFCFPSVSACLAAIRLFGVDNTPTVEKPLSERECVVLLDKSGNLLIHADKVKGDNGIAFAGWNSQQKKSKWSRVIRTNRQVEDDADDVEEMDNFIRRCSLSDGQSLGWCLLSDNQWKQISESESSAVCLSRGVDKGEVQTLRGKLISNSWTVVNLPFKPEYPGGRLWNRDAPQLAFTPAPRNDTRNSKHPHWDMILDHVGASLTPGVRQNEWCKRAGIATGREYLQAWIGSMIREPDRPLPYLFLFGRENCGKSILHEAAAMLLTKGAVKADRVLTNRDNFNGELEGCVLAVVEEVDVGNEKAHARLKDLVTSPKIAIRAMRRNVYEVPNLTSWIQVANFRENCWVPEGDSRITMIHVGPLTRDIPKDVLTQALTKEAPHFLRTLLDLNLPSAETRLRIPVIETQAKLDAMQTNQNPIIAFLEEVCHKIPGATTAFKEFYQKFLESTPNDVAVQYKERTMRGQLPPEYPVGKIAGEGNTYFVGNVSLDKKTEPSKPWTKTGQHLVK